MSTSRKIVSVQALCKDFQRPNGKTFTVLEGINLDVMDGEFLTILGISGSGKTTLLKCLAGLIEPDRGRVTFARNPNDATPSLSFVFQNFALFPWLTVRENVEVALQKLSRREKEARVDDFLDLVGLKGFEDCYPRELSGGMRQRVSLCRALAPNPMVVFMDEPFSALDPLTAQSLRAELTRIWKQPDKKIRSMVLVTHDLSEAIQMSDRIVILSANPGTVYKTIEIPLPRPRNPNSDAYKVLEEELETVFGELHLDRFLKDREEPVRDHLEITAPAETKIPLPKAAKLRPLINTSLVLVEGLITRLAEETGPMDLYDLCEDLGQSVDQMLPAVAASELLGFLYTPSTDLVITDPGRRFAAEQDNEQRSQILREACLRLPLIAAIHSIVGHSPSEGIEKEIAVEQIAMMLPFEDPDTQFEALIKWCRHTNLIVYDKELGRLLPGD